jgi:hypothetical protein
VTAVDRSGRLLGVGAVLVLVAGAALFVTASGRGDAAAEDVRDTRSDIRDQEAANVTVREDNETTAEVLNAATGLEPRFKARVDELIIGSTAHVAAAQQVVEVYRALGEAVRAGDGTAYNAMIDEFDELTLQLQARFDELSLASTLLSSLIQNLEEITRSPGD